MLATAEAPSSPSSPLSLLASFLGDALSLTTLKALLAEGKGDVQRSVNLYFENPARYNKPSSIHSAPASPPQKRSSPAGSLLPRAKRAKSVAPTYVGECILVALATVRGTGAIRDGMQIDPVTKLRAPIPLKTSSKKGGRKLKVKDSITRLCVAGREIAKLATTEDYLGKLIDQNVIMLRGSVVAVPPTLTLLCDVVLQVSVFFLPDAFTSTCTLDASNAQEEALKQRHHSLLLLFSLLGLRPEDTSLLHKEADAATEGEDEEGVELESDQVEILYNKARTFENVQEMEPKDGLTVNLRGYQKQALQWMSTRENLTKDPSDHSIHPLWEEYVLPPEEAGAESAPFYFNPYTGELSLNFPSAADQTRGGILADEMGLGKTIETLALIHSNRPSAGDMDDHAADAYNFNKKFNAKLDNVQLPATRSTLIVCPVSLIAQWRDEVVTRFRANALTCALHYGSERTLTVSDLTKRNAPDVVITSYGVVSSEGGEAKGKKPSLIFGVEWFRVVLDEAHWIKNKQTWMAKSCFKIEAKRRWAVTGTPIQNRLEDLFSLSHFLRLEPWQNFGYWRRFITIPFENKDPKALDVVQSILEPIVLRRQKSTPYGPERRPIVELPPKVVETEYLDFSHEERDIYSALHTKTKTQFSAFCAAGTVLSHWAHVFQMLTRLRQVCLHPSLALGKGSTGAAAESSQDIDDLIKRFQTGTDSAESTEGGNPDAYRDAIFHRLTQGSAVGDGASEEDASCPLCYDLMAQPTMYPCMHMSCYDCIVGFLQKKEQMGEPGECPICRKEFREEDLMDIIKAPTNHAAAASTQGEPVTSGGAGDDVASRTPLLTLRRHFHSSTKLKALVAQLKQLRETDPDVKTVVFSQFTSMLSLCEIVLREHGFGYARLDGTMNQKERERTLKLFASDDAEGSKVRVLLASMRTAGVGLNLVRASFVVILEPWWNAPVESQTIDRVHRIGQTRNVLVKRYIMRDSVEERMLEIQDRKTVLCKFAIGEGETGKESAAKHKEDDKKARIEELKTLFG
ncbi:DNA helicase rad5 [Thoreauomyces humboldtii]|nr:DNA helicase rad5 [Thoreauomyces humboldtii]